MVFRLLVPSCLLLLLSCQPSGEPEALVLTGVNLVSVEDGSVEVNQTVVMQGDRIRSVGPAAGSPVPPSARVIQTDGKYLIPGLYDSHVHFNEPDMGAHLALYLAHGVTTVQSMHGGVDQLSIRHQVESGELTGPRVLTTGPTTAREGVDSVARAGEVVQRQRDAGYDAIKMYGDGNNTMTRETYQHTIDEAHRLGLRVVGHAPRNLSFDAVLESGQDSIDHMEEVYYTADELRPEVGWLVDYQFGRVSDAEVAARIVRLDPAQVAESVSDEARTLASKVAESGLAITPTLIAFKRIWQQTTEEYDRLRDDPQLAYMHPVTRLNWGPQLNRYRTGGWANRFDTVEPALRTALEVQKKLVLAFHRAGVPLMAGTDAPLTFVIPGNSLHEELALLVESGLTPLDALRAATRVPATELGLLGEAPMISAGQRADLVLLEGNPLESISQAAAISGVVVAGRWFPIEELRQGLDELSDSYRPLEGAVNRIGESLAAGDPRGLVEAYRQAEDRSPIAGLVESSVNQIGYRLLAEEKVKEALEVFQLNADTFPEAFNTWDSLAEAHMISGNDELAREYYQKSLQLNPANSNATNMLKRLDERE